MDEEVDLRKVFDSMDLGNTGHIRAEDLQKGLSNGTDEPFNIKTCRMMIGMYDRDRSGTIDFNEFTQLYQFVDGWVKAFHQADADGTGEITQPELNKLLNDMGYRLGQKFYTFIGVKFNLVGNRGIKFDDFMYICILLNIITGMFAKMDYKRENEIELDYEQFINIVMDVTSI